MEEYVLSAIDKGLQKIIFLEHMEEGVQYYKTTWLSEDDFDYYFDEGNRLKEKYLNKISIGLGVEVGYNPHYREKLLQRLSRRKWDRIGISYHFHKDQKNNEYLNLLSRYDVNVKQLNHSEFVKIEKCYYTALIEAVKYLPGTVLCHLDAALRYHPLKAVTEKPWPLIETLLDCLKMKGMALEINTSGMTIRKEFFPAPDIVRMAEAKKIPLVAGSDAHRPEDVARHFHRL